MMKSSMFRHLGLTRSLGAGVSGAHALGSADSSTRRLGLGAAPREHPRLEPQPTIRTDAAKPPSQVEPKPSRDDIAARAYQIYLNRLSLGQEGDEASDWSQAERDLGQAAT